VEGASVAVLAVLLSYCAWTVKTLASTVARVVERMAVLETRVEYLEKR